MALTYQQLRDDPAVRGKFNQFNLAEKRHIFSRMDLPEGVSEGSIANVQKRLMMMTSEPDSQVPLQPGTETVNDVPLSWGQVGSEAFHNFDDSAIEYGKNLWQALRHPIETGKQLFGLMAGAVEKAIPGGEDKHAEIVDKTVDFFKERYGGSNFGEVVESIKRTMAEDPVGFLSDLSIVISGGSSVALKAVQTSGKIAKAATVAGAIPEITDVVNTASKVNSILQKSQLLDPATLAIKGATKGVAKGIKGVSTAKKTNQKFNSAIQKVLNVDGDLPDNRAIAQAAIERGINMTENDMKRAAMNRNKLGKSIENSLKKAEQEGGSLTHIDEISAAFDNVINDASRFKIEGANNPAFIKQLTSMKEAFVKSKNQQLTALDLQKLSQGIKFDAEIIDKFAGPANKVNSEIKSIVSTTLSDLFPETVKGKKFSKKFTKKRKDADLDTPDVEGAIEEFGWDAVSKEFGIQKQLDDLITKDITKHESKTTSGARGILVGGSSNVITGVAAGAAGFGAAGIPGAVGFTVAAFYISKFFDNPVMKARFARLIAKQRNIRISAAKKLVDQRITGYMADLQKQAQQAGRVSNVSDQAKGEVLSNSE